MPLSVQREKKKDFFKQTPVLLHVGFEKGHKILYMLYIIVWVCVGVYFSSID